MNADRSHLPGTTRTIATLKAAGFKRSEFSVRTPMSSKGEYKSTEIYLKCRFDATRHNVETLVQKGLQVVEYVGFNTDRSKTLVHIFYGFGGSYIVEDYHSKNEYGTALRTVIME